MTDHAWKWAQLSDDQLRLLKEAERSLGAGILLAFQKEGEASGGRAVPGLAAAALSESQMECLRGTEDQLGAVVVAYRQTA
jgi:hypothetical protein